jgi:hypothetical protein
MAFSALSHLVCSRSGERYDADAIQGVSDAGAPLLARYDLDGSGRRRAARRSPPAARRCGATTRCCRSGMNRSL